MVRSTTRLSLGRILGADAGWDLVLGVVLCVLPLITDARPWPLFLVLGVGSLIFAAVLWRAASQSEGALQACQAAAIGNTLAVFAALTAIAFSPGAALALAIAAVGCAVFAALEWQVCW